MHTKGKVPEALKTKQQAQPQTLPQIQSSSHAQSAAHHSSSSTSLLHEEQEVHPAVAVASEYPDSILLLGACSFVYTKSRYLCSQALQIPCDVPGGAQVWDSVPSTGPKGVRQLFSIPNPTHHQPLDLL